MLLPAPAGAVARCIGWVVDVSAAPTVAGSATVGSPYLASRTPTTVKRPSARAAKNSASAPTPVKNASCSATCLASAPMGAPVALTPAAFHSALTVGPTMNQAPPSVAIQAPNTPTARFALASTIKPPRPTAMAGSTLSQNRSVLQTQVSLGV